MREGQAPKGTGAPTARLTHPQRGADAVLADEARWRRADLRQSWESTPPSLSALCTLFLEDPTDLGENRRSKRAKQGASDLILISIPMSPEAGDNFC